MRYLVVFGQGWEVVDTHNDCKVMAKGSKDEMAIECDRLNNGGCPVVTLNTDQGTAIEVTPKKPTGNGIVRLV